jgi:hypothetical protein
MRVESGSVSKDNYTPENAGPRYDRRGTFRALVREVMSTAHALRGVRQFRLSQLGELPEHRLSAVIPEWRRHGQIRLLGSRLVQCGRDGVEISTLMEMGTESMRLLELFDGTRSVGEVAQAWAIETGLAPALAFAQLRSVWLPLAKLAVLVPPASFDPDAGADE